MMKATFHKKSESVKGQKSFDAQSLGFEQPAQTQLSRISKKLDRWENQAKLASEQKMQRDIWAKEILKKEEKKEQKMEKMFEQKQKLKRQEWKDHNEKREERIFKYNNDIKVEQKEIWQGVKAYYKEVKAFHKAKQEEEKKIYAKMMETYDAYKGTKAQEQLLKAQAYLQQIEEGQKLAQEAEKKILERIEIAKEHKRELSQVKHEYNTQVQPLKAIKANELFETQKYNVLQKNYECDLKTQKQMAKLQKLSKDQKKKMVEQFEEKLMKVKTQKQNVKLEIKEMSEALQEKYERVDNQVQSRKKGIINEKQIIAEKNRLHEADAKQNNQRIQTLKNIRNYKIYEKHALKEKVITDYNVSVSSLSKFM